MIFFKKVILKSLPPTNPNSDTKSNINNQKSVISHQKTMLLRFFIFLSAIGLFACHRKEPEAVRKPTFAQPQVLEDGSQIRFSDPKSAAFFKTQTISKGDMLAEVKAPAHISATVVASADPGQHIILFDNPDLTANYSALLQHNINIVQYRQNLLRTNDLLEHGAATGREVIEVKTQLADEQAALIEDEARLKLAGFNPEDLRRAKANTVWVTSDIPENQLNKIVRGGKCQVVFTSFPTQPFTGKVQEVGDVVDNMTRMVKLRIAIDNPGNQLKAGMFGTVQFGVSEGNFLAVPKESLVTVQGKNFVFVRKDSMLFERREVMTGQQINDKLVIYQGLQNGEQVVIAGAMQLKGLSFGY
jgi:membrane fusion protein, heavy metal efflux system